MPPQGDEQPSNSSGNPADSGGRAAFSGASDDAPAILADDADPRLVRVIEAWPALGEEVRRQILRLVDG